MASEDKESEAPPIDEVELGRPKLCFETITFSDGTKLKGIISNSHKGPLIWACSVVTGTP